MPRRMHMIPECNKHYRRARFPQDLYVCPERGDMKFTGALAEPNANHSDGPFSSIERARDFLRRRPLPGPVTVWIRGGRYELSEPLVFGSADRTPVTYRAMPGEEVVIAGGRRLSGWQEGQDDAGRRRWTCALGAEDPADFRQLFVNGRRARRTRWPKQGQLRIVDVPGGDCSGFMTGPINDRFTVDPADWQDLGDLTDAEVVAYHFWNEERLPVVSFDPASGQVVSDRFSVWPLKDDVTQRYARYVIENAAGALQEPGEWYCDRRAGLVHYLPLADERLAEAVIVAPVLQQLMTISGSAAADGQRVGGLCFRDLVFQEADWRQPSDRAGYEQAALDVPATIAVDGAVGCSFEGCTVRQVGGYALGFGVGAEGCRVSRCRLHDCGAGGVKIVGPGPEADDGRPCGGHLIVDSEICDGGHVFPSAVGVLLVHSAGNDVLHNHIHHLEYSGVSSGWTWGYGPSATQDNRINFNHIHHLGSGLLNDLGGIYTLGPQPGTELRGNRIHDIRMHSYGGWAMYCDEGSSYLLIEGNCCYRTDAEVLQLHYGRENMVRNNVFAFSELGQVSQTVLEAHRGITFIHNIVLTDGQAVYSARDGEDLAKGGFWADLNCLWDIGGRPVYAANQHRDADGETVFSRRYALDELRQRGFDRHSLNVDPGCADPAAGDFRLPADSPVWELGLQPMLWEQAGIRPDAACG